MKEAGNRQGVDLHPGFWECATKGMNFCVFVATVVTRTCYSGIRTLPTLLFSIFDGGRRTKSMNCSSSVCYFTALSVANTGVLIIP